MTQSYKICHGTGHVECLNQLCAHWCPCTTCDGTGKVEVYEDWSLGFGEEKVRAIRQFSQNLFSGKWEPAGNPPEMFGKYLCWITGSGLDGNYLIGLEMCDFSSTDQFPHGTWLQAGVTYWFNESESEGGKRGRGTKSEDARYCELFSGPKEENSMSNELVKMIEEAEDFIGGYIRIRTHPTEVTVSMDCLANISATLQRARKALTALEERVKELEKESFSWDHQGP